MDFDWKKLIGTVAPTIATALGGPLAGMATTAISEAVLGKPDGKEAEISAALANASPETLLKIKEADQAFAAKMKELDIDLEKIAASDRDSARKREMEVKDKTPARLAYTVIGGFIGISVMQLIALFFWPDEAKKIPPEGWLLVGNISGYLANEAKQAGAYYFGTTTGSSEKNATIMEAIKKQ